MTTAIPVSEAVPNLAPGVYLVVASPAEAKSTDYSAPATQWFIVSDLGLTALSGDDGLHALVRALVHGGAPFTGLEVRPTSLEEAFLAITAQPQPLPQPATV